jgi:hypothetical protein
MTEPTDQPPKQELLLKLLKMTTSPNDGEALTALRKANSLLTQVGWDWDKLIHSKIRIAADPFANLGTPFKGHGNVGTNAGRPHAAPSAPLPPRPTIKTTWPLGITPNKFAGFCYCCGYEVTATIGFVFRPNSYNSAASSDWKVACQSCNTTALVGQYAASRQRGTFKKPLVGDLA